MATETRAFAPAKINLALHVTGQRADGYHLLDSLVVFADVGDTITARAATGLHLTISGPMASGLDATPDNLVLRAARFLGVADAALRLEKNLPLASGIGGGSADAAATLRALCALTDRPLPDAADVAGLGADVPVCLFGRPCRMRGAGEALSPLPPLPPLWIVLANPGVGVSTPAVFRALTDRDGSPMPASPGAWRDGAAFGQDMRMLRNDLQGPACRIAPVIADVIAAMAAQQGCVLARMSGSGATCFGLFVSAVAAEAACQRLARAQARWWVRAGQVLD